MWAWRRTVNHEEKQTKRSPLCLRVRISSSGLYKPTGEALYADEGSAEIHLSASRDLDGFTHTPTHTHTKEKHSHTNKKALIHTEYEY